MFCLYKKTIIVDSEQTMTITIHSKQPIIPPLITQPHGCHTFLEVSKSAVNHNIAYYKNYIGPNNKLAVVIKGNGYGHDLVTMSLIAQENELADWICVAHYAEALNLVEAGITKDILIL